MAQLTSRTWRRSSSSTMAASARPLTEEEVAEFVAAFREEPPVACDWDGYPDADQRCGAPATWRVRFGCGCPGFSCDPHRAELESEPDYWDVVCDSGHATDAREASWHRL
jgi:hypothetical protein